MSTAEAVASAFRTIRESGSLVIRVPSSDVFLG
jgi:hypothetical protein